MAYIVEQAGGMAVDGKRRILDLVPKKIHERCPIVLGCKRDVEEVLRLQEEYDRSLSCESK